MKTTTIAQHTPTPWHVKTLKSVGALLQGGVYSDDRHSIALVDSCQEDAELIVRAVNSHEALLTACKHVITWFEKMKKDQHKKLVKHQTLESASENWDTLLQEPLDLEPLIKAIAQAEGK